MVKRSLKVFLLLLIILSVILLQVSVVAQESGAAVYIHQGNSVIKITTGITSGGTYTHNMLPDYVPENQYFTGWYDAQGNATNTVTVSNEAHLYAKYRDYPSDGVAVNYAGVENKPALKGVAYINDGVYSTTVNESGWALSGWNSEEGGAVLGKSFTGSAYAWEPAEQKATTQVAAKHNGYVTSSANHPVGTVTEVGWSAYSNYIIRDKDGYPIVPKPNTKYAVTITYELIEEGNITLYLCADRKLSAIGGGANAVAPSGYSDNYVASGLNMKGVKAGEQRTHTYYLTTADFDNSVPMLSVHCLASSFMAERVASAPGSDGKEYTSYKVGETTYYPYKIVSTPHAVIRQVAVNQVEEGNVVVNYQNYNSDVGFSATVVDGKPNTPAIAIDNNSATPKLWYMDENCQKLANTSVFPVSDTTYYSVSYLATHLNDIKNANLYLGAGETTAVKDGKTVKALNFKSDEYDMIRVGDAKNGHTYKLSFSLMAKKLEKDIEINIATAVSWDAHRLNNSVNGKGYVIKKDSVNADGQTWYDIEYYFTADPLDTNVDITETGVNYHTQNNRSNSVFMLLNCGKSDCDLYFTNIVLSDLGEVITAAGASVLTEEVQQESGSQAMRFYFDYKTSNGSDIIIGDNSLKVVERGFLYRDGTLAYNMQELGGFNVAQHNIKTSVNSNFDTCWSYNTDTSTMTFSTYVKDLNVADVRKIDVKAYIIIEDANKVTHFIHSDTVNRTIDGVKNGDKIDPTARTLVWCEEFNHYDSVSQLSTFTQKYDTMVPEDTSLSISTSEDNYFVDSQAGELVLRVTSDGNKNYTTAKSVTTRDIMVYKYGYLEMRAKVPFKKGMWPSFWLRPDTGAWNKATYSGEIDIFEVSAENSFSTGLHKWYKKSDGTVTNSAISGKGNILFGNLKYYFDNTETANEYHIYGFEWTPEYMAFYVDNELYCKIDITDETGEYDTNVPGMDCFRSYYYICLNNWVFTDSEQYWMPDRAETLEDFAQDGVDYRVDYIRLYQNSTEEIYIY